MQELFNFEGRLTKWRETNERRKKKNTISVLRSYAIFIIRAPWPSHHIYMLSLCGEPPLLTFRWSEVNVSNMLRDRDTSRVHFLSYVSHGCAFFFQAVVLLSIEWKNFLKISEIWFSYNIKTNLLPTAAYIWRVKKTCFHKLSWIFHRMFGTPSESKYKPLFSPLHIYISLQEQMPFQLLTSK